MSAQSEQFLDQLREAVATDQLKLPSLPDVALHIRKALESETQSAQQIADILSQDPSLAARLLQLANSPLYRARVEIDNLHLAVARLGVRIVRDLVTTLAMRQMFQTDSPVLEQHLRELWSCSIRVAAISRSLATAQPGLDREQALLAGLIHNIGALPIVMLAQRDAQLIDDSAALQQLTRDIQDPVGAIILGFWHFPRSLTDVVSLCHAFDRSHQGDADYVDIVQVALWQAGYGRESEAGFPAGAYQRLGLDATLNIMDDEPHRLAIEQTMQTLSAI